MFFIPLNENRVLGHSPAVAFVAEKASLRVVTALMQKEMEEI